MMRALILFGFLGLFASSAWGQTCKPVVLAFRHAEDTSAFQLTPTGTAHAELYKTMVRDFETTVVVETPPDQKPCRVTKVYAVTIEDKDAPCGDACKNATNAFNTAKPLATDRMGVDPITKVADPITNTDLKLFEYVGNGNNAPTDPTKPELYSDANATANALRTALLATANLGQSSAIFWTSQGLQVLGGAIIKGFSQVSKKDGWALPPRNAVYLFKAIGSAPNISQFEDTPTTPVTPTHPANVTSTVYVQCFNWLGATTQPKIGERDEDNFIKPGSTQIYYCGFGVQSSPGGKPPDGCNVNNPDPLAKECGLIPNGRTKDLKGKICDTRALLPDTHGSDVFGACQ